MAKKQPPGSRHKDRRTIRISEEMYQRIATLAQRNHRPTQWEAKLALEKHLTENGLPPEGSDA